LDASSRQARKGAKPEKNSKALSASLAVWREVLRAAGDIEVERIVPNALFDSAIRKRLEDKSLHPRCRARKPADLKPQISQMDTDEQTVTPWRRPTFRVSCSAFRLFIFSSFFIVLSVKIRVIRGQ
jgi:hypothetical protein